MRTLTILFVILVSGQPTFGQFSSEQIVTGGSNDPLSFDVGDMDGDGDLDIVAAVCDWNKIIWYENLGSATFRAQRLISSEVDCGLQVLLADFNNDGQLDIASASLYDDKIAWYENIGGGNFADQVIIGEGFTSLRSIHVLDINNDGNEDLIFTSNEANKVQWFENNGGGDFSLAGAIHTTSSSPHKIRSGDIDGDGDLDIAVGSWGDDRITWNENLGDGTFSTENIITTDPDSPEEIDLVDLDDDGDLDLLYAAKSDDEVAWFPNLGDGTFGPKETIATGFYAVRYVRAADLDGDGDKDVVAMSNSTDQIIRYDNLGGGIFDSPDVLSADINQPLCLVIADINSSGHQDIIVASSEARRISWHENIGGGSFEDLVKLTHESKGNRAAAVGDLDNDGDLDVLSAGGQYGWNENLGNGVYAALQSISGTGPEPSAIAAGDIDGDGDLDVVMACDLGGDIMWAENDGSGNFSPYVIVTVYGSMVQAISLADLDGDGDIDVASASLGTNRILWYANDGTGTFAEGAEISIITDEAEDVFTIDLDGDGDIDVLSASKGDDKIAWYENLGAGTFGPQQILSADAGSARSVYAYDLDSDGDLDIISGAYDDHEVMFFENIGDAIFSDGVVISTLSVYTTAVYACDIDEDGDGDILAVNMVADRIDWYENLGGLSFSDKQVIATDINEPYVILTADMDNDGDKDILSGSYQDSKIALFENYFVHPNQGRGTVFVDLNENGVKDDGEMAPNFVQVQTTPEAGYGYIYPNGKYFVNFDGDLEEAYIISLDGGDIFEFWNITTDSTEYHISVNDDFDFRDSLDFGIYPDTLIYLLNPDITGQFPRCDNIINYWLHFGNSGTTTPNGILKLELHDSISYVSASVIPDSIVDQSIYWHYDTLDYFEYDILQVSVQMPNFLSMGDVLTSTFNITADSLGTTVYSQTDTLNQTLVCAYDPNDKIGTPAGLDSLGFITQEIDEIEYTIRFQNTGTDTAFNIQITDQLDPNLDWSTFEYVSASHSGPEIDMTYGGEVTFTFNDILLPDSNVNEIASHGYIKYRIQLEEDLPTGTQIFNTANIYFDANPAIVTNTKINTIYDCESILSNFEISEIYCFDEIIVPYLGIYPSNMLFQWTIEDSIITTPSFEWSADSTGVFELLLHLETDFCSSDSLYVFEVIAGYEELMLPVVSICETDSLLIFGTYQQTAGIYHDTLNTIHGCDSLLAQELIVHARYDFVLDTQITCVGDSALILGLYQHSTGIYYDTLNTIQGCDSIYTQSLIVNDLPLSAFTELEDAIVCKDEGLIILSGTPSGGMFSGPGVTDSNFDATIAGEGEHTLYYFYEDDNGCSATDSIQVSVVYCLQIDELSDIQISIYPNPFDDFTTLNFGRELIGENHLRIYNSLGQIVYQEENIKGAEVVIYQDELKSGVYLLSIVNSDNTNYTARLIIQ